MTTTRKNLTKNGEYYNRLGFWALLMTQFQGAFSDNVYKLIIIFYAKTLVEDTGSVTSLATAVFNLPWLLFPAIAGALGDRFSKKRVTVWTKIWELGVMSMGVIAVFFSSPVLLFFTLFLMAMQSTFFSPAKYGILPEILPESKLSWGNGLLNMWTFLAIIIGSAVAGVLTDSFSEGMHYVMMLMVLFSLFGLGASLLVTPSAPAAPERRIPVNPYAGMGKYFRMFAADKRLLMTMVGIAYFWFAGALVLQNVIELGDATYEGDTAKSILLALMALGIGVGSLAAGFLSRGKIELGLIPVGLFGLTLMGFLLAIPGLSLTFHLTFLFLLGFFAGMFDVPLAAMLQQRSPDDVKGGMIATSNFVTFAAMMVAAGLFWVLFSLLHCSPQCIFLVTALMTTGVGVYLCLKEPMLLVRTTMWLLDGTLLRWHVRGRKNIPEKGGAVLVAPHISLVDVFALLAAVDRQVYFVVGEDIYKAPLLGRLARYLSIVPVPPKADRKAMKRIQAEIRRLVAAGHVVCVNTEARYHADSEEAPWHSNYGRLTKNLKAPVVPVFMSRLKESLYTFEENQICWRWPGRFRYPIYISFDLPRLVATGGVEVRECIQTMGTDILMAVPFRFPLLSKGFLTIARRSMRRMAMADLTSGQLSYFKALVGSIIFARKLKQRLDNQKMVGVLVPPTVGGALTNLALQFMGRVAVNLNYTASSETMQSCAEQCNITQVLTSKKFLERLPLDVPGEPVFLEDIKDSVTKKDRILGILYALFAPHWFLCRSLGAPKRTEDDLATVIFSSGSEGQPKGIMLTHRNIMSQVETIASWVPHHSESCVLAFLPFFHSFGFSVTLWMALLNNVRCVYHPNPLEPRILGNLVKKYKCTLVIGTSTFLQGFIRRCTPEQMESLEMVIAGAEKLPNRVRDAFQRKFGVEPLEGYGATECAPIISVSTPDFTCPGFFTHYCKRGSIGRPLPGESLRVVDPDTGALLSRNEPGLLQVKGPNVMRGYLNQPEKTASVLKDGWYSTGDIAAVDETGFITITDRLARFSKIAGEMVPHNKVETLLHDLLGLTEQALAVTSVPDTQKGERLVVLHTLSEEQLDTLLNELHHSTLPNLWRPRANAFYCIDEIPVLGTGKMDLKAVKQLALALDLGE